jgi:hypothetical protein
MNFNILESKNTMSKIRKMQSARDRGKRRALDEIYSRVSSKILDAERQKTRCCIYKIPPYVSDGTVIDIPKVASWLKRKLEVEGFTVMSLEGIVVDIDSRYRGDIGTVADLMIVWSNKDDSDIYRESSVKINEEDDLSAVLANNFRS